jgi:hypothetical protein
MAQLLVPGKGGQPQGDSIYFPSLRKLPGSGEFSNRQVEEGKNYSPKSGFRIMPVIQGLRC